MTQQPTKTCTLRFDKTLYKTDDDFTAVRDNLSAIAVHEDNLWLGGDEGTVLHRLTRDANGDFATHRPFELRSLLQLPINDAKAEIDIEGLDIHGGYLWVLGSHSLKRRKPEQGKTLAKNLARLADLPAEGNRFTLGRVPLQESKLVQRQGDRMAARLAGDAHGNQLTRALAADEHLGPFVLPPNSANKGIPSKDNGLDIEGLAVTGNRVFVGLRGPVLRGWVAILELALSEAAPGILQLEPLPAGSFYRKYFLELNGLGIRDVAIDGQDLLILTGPTMHLDGPAFLYRWEKGLQQSGDTLVWNQDLRRILSLPCGNPDEGTEGKDHPEGIALLNDPLSVMVCYDAPSKDRIDGQDHDGIIADIFVL